MALNEDIIIVSGLPRSGTSLMMQMLACGGIAVVTDRVRSADEDNPRGYFELEAVKRTRHDSAWVASARGRAVKLVSSLLYDLPETETYRVLFMQRDIEEVLESQEKMLQRLGRSAAPRDEMRAAFEIHLERLHRWLPEQPHMRSLMVDYNQLVTDPIQSVQAIVDFLDGQVAAHAMQSAVDPALYRNRAAAGDPGTLKPTSC